MAVLGTLVGGRWESDLGAPLNARIGHMLASRVALIIRPMYVRELSGEYTAQTTKAANTISSTIMGSVSWLEGAAIGTALVAGVSLGRAP
jgi:hypothetical protein